MTIGYPTRPPQLRRAWGDPVRLPDMVNRGTAVIDRETGTTGVTPALSNVWRVDLAPELPR